jgi:hypothetical protein
MLTQFWEAIGNKFADRWASASIPALVFWIGGLLAWVRSRGGFSALRPVANWLGHQPAPTQIALILVALLGVAATGMVLQRLTTPAQRLLEGYWPRIFDKLRNWLINRVTSRANSDLTNWGVLAARVSDGSASPRELLIYSRIDQRIRRVPANPAAYQPTRMGNSLRSAQSRPYDKYGLDANTLWPRLILLLPDATRKEFESARQSLEASVAALLYSIGFLVFTPWTPLVIPVSLSIAFVTYFFWIPTRAETVADLLETVFDLHRTAIYEQLRWPLPSNPQDEHASGLRLTEYLARGSDASHPTFTIH